MTTFIVINILSLLVVVSSDNFFVIFIMMEISNVFFYPIFLKKMSPPALGGGMKYFISQAIGSSIFLLGSFISGDLFYNFPISKLLIMISLILKMGLFPSLGWVMMVAENISWMSLIYLLTIQKVIPFVILSKMFNELEIHLLMVSISTLFIMTAILFNKFNNMRWMLIYSSNINMCWMILASWVSLSSMLFYLILYFFLLLFFSIKMETMNMKNISPMMNSSYDHKGGLLSMMVVYFISGLPPLGVFLGKMEIILELTSYSDFFMPIVIFHLFISAILTWFYSKLMISFLLSCGFKTNWFTNASVLIMLLVLSSIISIFFF